MKMSSKMNNLERYYSPILKGYGASPKPVKIIDEKYLEEIRHRDCKISEYTLGCVAHHVQKKSQTRNDYLAIPLEAKIHTNFHSDEIHSRPFPAIQ